MSYELMFGRGSGRWDLVFGRGYDPRGATWELMFGRGSKGLMSEDELTQLEEIDKVLAEIERLEASDPTFERPSWIPDQTMSRRNLRGLLNTDHSLFPSDESFEGALQRYFPQPRDRG